MPRSDPLPELSQATDGRKLIAGQMGPVAAKEMDVLSLRLPEGSLARRLHSSTAAATRCCGIGDPAFFGHR